MPMARLAYANGKISVVYSGFKLIAGNYLIMDILVKVWLRV